MMGRQSEPRRERAAAAAVAVVLALVLMTGWPASAAPPRPQLQPQDPEDNDGHQQAAAGVSSVQQQPPSGLEYGITLGPVPADGGHLEDGQQQQNDYTTEYPDVPPGIPPASVGAPSPSIINTPRWNSCPNRNEFRDPAGNCRQRFITAKSR